MYINVLCCMRKRIFISLLCLSVLYSANKEYRVITVQKGETLTKIAKKYLDDPRRWRELLKYNNIKNPNLIYPGRKLKLPLYLAKKPIAQAIFKIGKAERKPALESKWMLVRPGTPFYVNDIARTGKKSKLSILFGQSTKVTLQAETYLTISKNLKGESPQVRLRRGRLQAYINKLRTGSFRKSSFRVLTPSAVAGTRGTVFLTEVDSKGNSLVATYEGEMAVTAQKVTVEVPSGYVTKVEKGKPPQKPVKILPPPVIY
ncbi:MAG: LysM peptidoglycan-binding domain-containing protein [Candidatus Hydrogenedentota bacterium]|nr:MAG: LysM peptidoglycan-binding domain-containing protein [Candidatus Hydrogenedentota bacterium]